MRPGALMWVCKKWVSAQADQTTGSLPVSSSVEEGECVDDETRSSYSAGISHDCPQSSLWERSRQAPIVQDLKDGNITLWTFPIGFLLFTGLWSRPPQVSSMTVFSVGTRHLFQSSCQDTVAIRTAESLKNPSKGLTFPSCPWRKYSAFFRNCNTAGRDAMLTWHHRFSEA